MNSVVLFEQCQYPSRSNRNRDFVVRKNSGSDLPSLQTTFGILARLSSKRFRIVNEAFYGKQGSAAGLEVGSKLKPVEELRDE